MLDSKALAAATAEIVREHVAKATEPLLRRIDELEKRQPQAGEPGRDGLSVTLDDVAPMIAGAVERAVKSIPLPKDGRDGQDGVAVDQQAVERMVAERLDDAVKSVPTLIGAAVERAVAALPVPKDGLDGQDGRSFDPAELEHAVSEKVDGSIKAAEPLITELVARAVEALPAPAPGRDGADGQPADPAEIARLVSEGIDKAVRSLPPAQNGKDGRDGVSVAGALIDRDGALVVTLSNGETRSLGVVVGRDGKDGERGAPGRDGLRVIDFDLKLEPDGRTLVMSLDDGDVSYAAEIGIPTMIYRGVFTDGAEYERGDTVTWAGSLWHCNLPTKDKPGEGAEAWTLAVKRGRDAKPAAL